jgi:hypothetical protein
MEGGKVKSDGIGTFNVAVLFTKTRSPVTQHSQS